MSLIVDDIFEVLAKDAEGKKFEKVSRLRCRSNYHEYELTIDVNCAIYALEEGDKFTLGLADSLYRQGQGSGVEDGVFDQSGLPSLMDQYDYVMYGKLYKFVDSKDQSGSLKVEVYMSFGGLLMLLKGDYTNLKPLKLDSRYYLLMRKV